MHWLVTVAGGNPVHQRVVNPVALAETGEVFEQFMVSVRASVVTISFAWMGSSDG